MGVRAVITPRPLPVGALIIAGCEVQVTNDGPTEDEYSFVIDRHAAQWGWVTPPTVTVPPGGQGSVKVLFRLPQSPKPPAGPLPFTVTVASTRDKASSTVAEGTVDVQPIHDLVATLNPRTAEGSGPSHHVVAVSNRGNGPARARITATDPGGHLTFDIEPVTVEAASGTTAEAKLRVSPKAKLRRGSVERPFQVVADVEGQEPLTVEGVLTQKGTGFGRSGIFGVVLLVMLLVGGAVVAVAAVTSGGGTTSSVATTGTSPAAVVDTACPAKGHDNRDRAATGQLPFNFSFLFTTPDGCQPVRFNPCEPIHFIVNPSDAPAGGVADVRQAFKLISDAGGYTFVDDGTTDTDRFNFSRQPYDPARYGERWAPIVISWSKLGNRSTNDVVIAGMGNGVPVDNAIVTGMLNLNADARIDLARTVPVPDGFGTGISWGRVMLHELGHVFGLGHVDSKNEIMHEQLLEQTLSRTEYGIGDHQAFRFLGKEAGCVQAPAPRTVPPLGTAPRGVSGPGTTVAR